MAQVQTTFDQLIEFTRGTGATRINAAGLIVGVDFSSTSITFGTGSKAFTLTADANVNRDWSIGEEVIAVSQAAPLGSMTGTVVSYDPATQVLTIDVVTSTGTGTGTNWRLGSLAVRRDADGVLREPLRSNTATNSNVFNAAPWVISGTSANGTQGNGIQPVITPNAGVSPDGSANATRIVLNANGTTSSDRSGIFITNSGLNPASLHAFEFFIKPEGSLTIEEIIASQTIGVVQNGGVRKSVVATPLANGWFYLQQNSDITLAGGNYRIQTLGTAFPSAISFLVYGYQIGGATLSSYIPTTTVAVTRNADTFLATPETIAALRQGEGTLILEANASDAGTAQRAALRLTGPSGEIRFGKQGVATSGNFTKMAEGGDVQLLGNATQGVTNNGLEYSPINPIETRTGNPVGPFGISGVAYDGSTSFGVTTSGNGESVLPLNLSQADGKGIGGGVLNGAHHNGSRFLIAAGSVGLVLISTDGLSYRRINTPVITQPCNEVTSGDVSGTLRNVIVGNAGFIATSDDNGETWVSRVSGTASAINAVTRSTTNFIVAISIPASASNIRNSSDGITWNAVANSGTARALVDIHANGSTVVAVGGSGAITVSLDNGATWTASPSSEVVTTQQLNGVHYNASANLWVAVGVSGTIITATDPTGTWTLQNSGIVNSLAEVNYFNGLWVAAGAQQTIVTSPNAINWTVRTSNVTSTLVAIAASPTRLIITGTAGGFASSEDGLTYTSRTNNNATLNGIAYGAGVYVSVGNAVNGSGYIATIDGAGTVTRRVSGTVNSLTNVRFINGAFYVTESSALLRSIDGATWSRISIANLVNTVFLDVAYSGSLHIAVATNGRYSTSSDGVAWNNAAQVGVTTQALAGIDFANGTFVIVGSAGVILTTTNGTTYTLRTSGTTQNLTSVIYSERDQRWYAAGNAGTLLYSEDNGETWASVNNAGFGAVFNTTLQANKLAPMWQDGLNKIAMAYKNNEMKLSINGSVSTIDTEVAIPFITSMFIGDSFNGRIRRLTYKPIAVDPQLETQL